MFTVAKKKKVKVRNFSRVNSQETANTYACFLHQPLPEQGFWNPQFAAFKHTAQTDLSLNVQAKNTKQFTHWGREQPSTAAVNVACMWTVDGSWLYFVQKS